VKIHQAIAQLLGTNPDQVLGRTSKRLQAGYSLRMLAESFYITGQLSRLSGLTGIFSIDTPIRQDPEFYKFYRR
jgi:hypothetical protein